MPQSPFARPDAAHVLLPVFLSTIVLRGVSARQVAERTDNGPNNLIVEHQPGWTGRCGQGFTAITKVSQLRIRSFWISRCDKFLD